MTGAQPSESHQRRRAISFVLTSAALFAISSVLVKLAAPEIPTVQLMFFRSGVALLFVLPLVARAGGWSALHTRRPGGHLLRALSGLAGMFGSYYGLAQLPLAAVTALGFAMPLFLAALSVPLLHERLTPTRIFAVAAGLVGVLLVIRPWQGAAGLPLWPTAIVIAGVFAWAVAMASIRMMGQSGERNITIVILFSLVCTLLSAILAIPVWVMPRPGLWPILIGIGAVSGLAQLAMTEGYRSGESSMLAPFEYSAILYTVVIGWLLWGETVGPWESTGILVLVLSGLFTWWREARS